MLAFETNTAGMSKRGKVPRPLSFPCYIAILICCGVPLAESFSLPFCQGGTNNAPQRTRRGTPFPLVPRPGFASMPYHHECRPPRTSILYMADNNKDDNISPSFLANESDQTLLGVVGTVAGLVTLYSEYTLKTTGCGLPAGPFGLVGGIEGVSYLGVVGFAGVSLYKKLKTGSGLPAGPGGLLGAAEGLSFSAILAGVVVLGFQITDYGYIPNAVPGEGQMCK
jgi:hypothetical protein